MINADGTGDPTMVTKDLRDNEEMPVVSHNGRYLAYRAFTFEGGAFFEAVRVMSIGDWRRIHEYRLPIPDLMLIKGIGWSRSDRKLYVAMESSEVSGQAMSCCKILIL